MKYLLLLSKSGFLDFRVLLLHFNSSLSIFILLDRLHVDYQNNPRSWSEVQAGKIYFLIIWSEIILVYDRSESPAGKNRKFGKKKIIFLKT